jgi:hypothetical protein
VCVFGCGMFESCLFYMYLYKYILSFFFLYKKKKKILKIYRNKIIKDLFKSGKRTNDSHVRAGRPNTRSKGHALGERVFYSFQITQHSRDLGVMQQLPIFFGCGTVHLRGDQTTPRCDFIVQDKEKLLNQIVAHFDPFPLENAKQLEFLYFKEAMRAINNGKHLTRGGMDQIKALITKINTGRK